MPSLDKLVARNLGCSRAEARRLLHVRGGQADLAVAGAGLPFRLDLDGRCVDLYDEFHLMLNKPVGCVTALQDAVHPTALAYLHGAPLRSELRPVGRLDLESTGLLLWTTDGDLVHRLTHPRSAIPRCYHVALARAFVAPPPELVLRDGYRPKIVTLQPAAAPDMHPSLLRPTEATAFASITIVDGAYHEVRRIFAALGSHVLALCRVSFGNIELPSDLAPGTWQPLPRARLARPSP